MDYLEILDPQGKRKHYKLDQPRFLIGRESTCDICLPHPNVSRRHAQLQRTEEGGWLLQDLKSLNKVYYNDGPVQQIMLEPGKSVRIGEFRIALKPTTTPPESVEVVASDEESSPSWPGLDPGWLEQLQRFQRALLRYDQPRLVLERLADEFQRIARPQLL